MMLENLYLMPTPRMHERTKTSRVNYNMRLVWYALLCIGIYPVYANEIRLLVKEMGVKMTSSLIGYYMAKLCTCGYFIRERKGRVYKYNPTSKFTMIQRRWRDQD